MICVENINADVQGRIGVAGTLLQFRLLQSLLDFTPLCKQTTFQGRYDPFSFSAAFWSGLDAAKTVAFLLTQNLVGFFLAFFRVVRTPDVVFPLQDMAPVVANGISVLYDRGVTDVERNNQGRIQRQKIKQRDVFVVPFVGVDHDCPLVALLCPAVGLVLRKERDDEVPGNDFPIHLSEDFDLLAPTVQVRERDAHTVG